MLLGWCSASGLVNCAKYEKEWEQHMKAFFLGLLALSSLAFSFAALAGIEDFEGIARIPRCSASLVKFKNQSMDEKAMILTTDYCTHNQAYKKFEVNVPYKVNVSIYNKDRRFIQDFFTATRVIYATQTTTDLALLELEMSYQTILDKHGVLPLLIDDGQTPVGSKISVLSGFMGEKLDCLIDAITYKIIEGTYISRNSYRLGGCFADMGTSGSPMILQGTKTVVGITNTSNFNYTDCTDYAVCEVTEEGKISIFEFTSYGQQLNDLYTCLDDKSNFDLSHKGCKLLGGDSWVE